MTRSSGSESTCPNGHVVPDAGEGTSGTQCPECGEAVSSRPAARRGLWAMMGRTSETTDSHDRTTGGEETSPDSEAAGHDTASESRNAGEPPVADVSESGRPRGLWAVMGQRSAASNESDVARESDATQPERHPDVGRPGTSGEYDLSEFDSPDTGDAPESEPVDVDDDSEDDLNRDDVLADDDEEDGWEVDSEPADLDHLDQPIEPDGAENESTIRSAPGHRRSLWAIGVGCLSLLLALLTLLPQFWVKIPATVAGAVALVCGYQAYGESRRAVQRSTIQMLAGCGIAAGLTGIFLGPLLLNDIGRRIRETSDRSLMQQRLATIGEGVGIYHGRQQAYPMIGTHEVDPDGNRIAMHSWITSLLPYLGDDYAWSSSLALDKPWSDPANRELLRRPIPLFLSPDQPHVPTPLGYATTHFSAVSGDLMTPTGRARSGIFGLDGPISREQIEDGMSQTLVIGEVAAAFSPWGDPENWRTVEDGLNQRRSGFGNASRTGAWFLMADGSTRFLSNRISSEVLQQLATRDGGEFIREAPDESGADR